VTVAFTPGGNEYAASTAYGAIGLGAQFKAAAAIAATVVVCLVNEVTQGQFTGTLGGGELGA
jgi:hypothetical protein